MSPGYSAAQTARLVSALRWVCGRLSEIIDGWACEAAAAAAPDPRTDACVYPERAEDDAATAAAASVAVEMTVMSRRLASHRDVLSGLQPDSERLASWRPATPGAPSLVVALDEIAALPGPLERLAVIRQVLIPQLVDAYREIGEHAAPHCDAALASAAESLHHDLAHNRPVGAVTPAGKVSDSAAAAAESRLSKAGGIVGRSRLRPAGWD